ncbi:MAG: HIT family protein [Solirubrobacteraceae bacterium]
MSRNPLWAPWRSQYVSAPKNGECIFCSALGGVAEPPHGGDDLVVDRGAHCFAVLNAYPYAAGHVMVAPYRHTGDLLELSAEEERDMMLLARRVVRALGHLMTPAGFNLGLNLGKTAGAGFAEHLHMHVVPRWDGDTNFMPVLADTNVISAALGDTAAAMRAKLSEDTGAAAEAGPS